MSLACVMHAQELVGHDSIGYSRYTKFKSKLVTPTANLISRVCEEHARSTLSNFVRKFDYFPIYNNTKNATHGHSKNPIPWHNLDRMSWDSWIIHSFIHDFITENIFCHFHPFRVIKERNGKGNYFFLYSICFVRFEITLYLLCHMLVVK